MNGILATGITLKNNTYRVINLLGQGGFGAVYLAEKVKEGTRCAVKENYDNSPGAQAQFAVEATILMLLNHPTLTSVTDHFVEPSGKQYLVMEYVEGRDISDILEQRGPLPEKQVLAWMTQVLEAVAYLHSYQPRPVIHRDIKPANIRLLPDGQTVKLVDFGIAKIGGASDQTRSAARAYSPGFSPPEQYGTGGTAAHSDVYALGATLYNLLTNVLPPASIDIAYAGAQLIPPRHYNPQISAEVEQVILTAMQIDPQLRFPNAREMLLALQGKRPTTTTFKCPHCGAKLRRGAQFCSDCGRTLTRVAPFTFAKSGYRASDIKELVRGCDSYWDEAAEYFRRGEFDPWLRKFGAAGQKLAATGQSCRARHSNDHSAALEDFLEAADPTRSLPILTVDKKILDFKAVRVGDNTILPLQVSNSGRGYLYGTVQPPSENWLTVHPTQFGCLAGKPQQLEVEIKTQGLSGTEIGADYGAQFTLLSNRGRQMVTVKVKVVDEPRIAVDTTEINLGKVRYGAQPRGQLVITNSGGGTLRGTMWALEQWLTVDAPSANFSLSKGHSRTVYFVGDTIHLARRGQNSGQLQAQSNGGSPVVMVKLEVMPPFLLDVVNPQTALNKVAELRDFCEGNWDAGAAYLYNGRIEAFLYFIGEDDLARRAGECRRIPHQAVGLETFLRAAGAPPPQKYETNDGEVLAQLGLSIVPKFGKPPKEVIWRIENRSKRGYLHGYLQPLAEWLSIPQPRFGCLPGEIAEVRIAVDASKRKVGLFSLGIELLEMVVE